MGEPYGVAFARFTRVNDLVFEKTAKGAFHKLILFLVSPLGLFVHSLTAASSGVALAAIQGLNRKLETQLRQKDAQILLLERKVEKLERMEITVRKLQALLPSQ